MKKIAKIIGIGLLGLIAVVVIGAVGVYLYFKPASSQTMCENVFKITSAELEKQLNTKVDQATIEKMSGMTVAKCVEQTDREMKSERGLIYKSVFSKCVVKATTMDELKGCADKAEAAVKR